MTIRALSVLLLDKQSSMHHCFILSFYYYY